MDSKEIFYALQSGTMSSEDAEQALISLLNTETATTKPFTESHPAENPLPQTPVLSTSETSEDWLADLSSSPLQGASVVQMMEIEPTIVQISMQDRSNKNAFSLDVIKGLIQAFQSIQANVQYKVVILTGYEKYFASGGNQDGLQALQEGRVKMTDVNLHSLLLECEIPVIAAMQGHALGGGWCFGLFCDFIIMSQQSSYSCNHMRYGFTPGDGATLIFPTKFGHALAQEILFTGKTFRGSELQSKGAPLPIVPGQEVLPYALQLARDLAMVPRESLVLLKAHMTASLKAQLPFVLEKEWSMQEKTFVNNPHVMQKINTTFNQATKHTNGQKDQQEEKVLHAGTPPLQHCTASPPVKAHATREHVPSQLKHFPEIIALNRIRDGRPVIWLHGDGGGVEGYHNIAQHMSRPFYGIQARGRATDDSPMCGISAMADYYVQLIRAIQPVGPYDLGGYALGGTLAYEVTRQLQEVGQAVETLLMLDSLDPSSLPMVSLSAQTKILQTINMALLNRIRQEPEKLFQKLIHHQEMQDNISDEEQLQFLIRLGRTRGLSLTKTDSELFSLFQKNLQIQQAFAIEQFVVTPLSDPQSVACYYFRNKSGLFYGDFQPYLVGTHDHVAIDHTDYWHMWEQLLPNFHMLDVESHNHITLLFEPAALQAITTFCHQLYQKIYV